MAEAEGRLQETNSFRLVWVWMQVQEEVLALQELLLLSYLHDEMEWCSSRGLTPSGGGSRVVLRLLLNQEPLW